MRGEKTFVCGIWTVCATVLYLYLPRYPGEGQDGELPGSSMSPKRSYNLSRDRTYSVENTDWADVDGLAVKAPDVDGTETVERRFSAAWSTSLMARPGLDLHDLRLASH
jgi:hypothetical protein